MGREITWARGAWKYGIHPLRRALFQRVRLMR